MQQRRVHQHTGLQDQAFRLDKSKDCKRELLLYDRGIPQPVDYTRLKPFGRGIFIVFPVPDGHHINAEKLRQVGLEQMKCEPTTF